MTGRARKNKIYNHCFFSIESYLNAIFVNETILVLFVNLFFVLRHFTRNQMFISNSGSLNGQLGNQQRMRASWAVDVESYFGELKQKQVALFFISCSISLCAVSVRTRQWGNISSRYWLLDNAMSAMWGISKEGLRIRQNPMVRNVVYFRCWWTNSDYVGEFKHIIQYSCLYICCCFWARSTMRWDGNISNIGRA